MNNIEKLSQEILTTFAEFNLKATIQLGELTIEIAEEHLYKFCRRLYDIPQFSFEQLIDLCGVDYLEYGLYDWATERTTSTGFSRGVEKIGDEKLTAWQGPRFAVVYHLLSLTHNQRLRIRTFAEGEPPKVHSVVGIWDAANWFEREAYDLFGIIFIDHPDLRRILTDYGFVGHPFRKDFPLIGEVEPRYDAREGKVINEPVSIPPRTLVPKVIREDTRYIADEVKPLGEDK
jgi:NADH-quinone oxidoreductase subunit C